MTVNERLEWIDDENATDEFDAFIDDSYEPVNIMGITVYPCEMLKTDPIAYRQAYLDYFYNERGELYDRIENGEGEDEL